MMRAIFQRSVVVAGLALAGLLAACGPRGGTRPPCPPGEQCLNTGSTTEPFTLDPNKFQMSSEYDILRDLMVGLTAVDARGKVIPGMATSWTTSPDGLTWTFRLREARWSDGVPVTAADFVESFRRIQDPSTASPYSYLLYPIKGAQEVNAGKAPREAVAVFAPDPRTLVLKLVQPTPHLPQILTYGGAMPVPVHALARWGDRWVEPGKYVSNGAYTLAARMTGDRVVLRKNPSYWNAEKVCFDQVSYFAATDLVSAERRVAARELDTMALFEPKRAPFLRKSMPGYIDPQPMFWITYISFNAQVPALQDRRVRLAAAMGIDRTFITRKLSNIGQQPLYGFTPSGFEDYTNPPPPAWAAWPFERRLAAARELMRQAGYTPERPLRLELSYYASFNRSIAAAVKADWRRIGLDVTLASAETQIHYQNLNTRNFQIAFDGWTADFADPITFLELLRSTAGAQNHSGYASPRYDDLILRAENEPDAQRRLTLLNRAERLIMDDWPVAPIYVNTSAQIVNPALTGFYNNPLDIHPKEFVCRS